ncbi:50S ribosomal protein L9 [Candidatus Omnitrophota bacterium]
MKIILMKDVDKLGGIGDELEVKDGYARNFLIPRKVAIESTKGAVRILEAKKRERARRDEQIKVEFETLAEKIQAASCTISVDVGEEDKMFGSVTSDLISEVLGAEGIEVDKKKIVLEEPIKTLGVHNVDIKLHPEVTAQAKIWVVKK